MLLFILPCEFVLLLQCSKLTPQLLDLGSSMVFAVITRVLFFPQNRTGLQHSWWWWMACLGAGYQPSHWLWSVWCCSSWKFSVLFGVLVLVFSHFVSCVTWFFVCVLCCVVLCVCHRWPGRSSLGTPQHFPSAVNCPVVGPRPARGRLNPLHTVLLSLWLVLWINLIFVITGTTSSASKWPTWLPLVRSSHFLGWDSQGAVIWLAPQAHCHKITI